MKPCKEASTKTEKDGMLKSITERPKMKKRTSLFSKECLERALKIDPCSLFSQNIAHANDKFYTKEFCSGQGAYKQSSNAPLSAL